MATTLTDAAPMTAETASTARRAKIYRMATPEHLCPFGLRALDLLRREGW